MPPKNKSREVKPITKRKQLTDPPTNTPPPSPIRRKCKKELVFSADDDDTPIAHLLHKAPGSLTPKTPKTHERARDPAQPPIVTLSTEAAATSSPHIRAKKRKCRSKRKNVPLESFQAALSKPQATEAVTTSSQFTLFCDMSQENNTYSMQVKIIHYWSASVSAIETSLLGFLVIKDSQGSLMQVFIPEFLLASYKNKFVRGMSFKIRDVILFKSTRRTKLVDSLFELHFTESTTAIQLADLPIDLGPLFQFEDLAKIPIFLPSGDITTSQLSVRDIICIVVDMTPVLKRIRRGKIIKFVETYITDHTIWPSCCLLTIWEDTALKYGQQFLHGFAEQFVLIAQHVRPNCYKGKYGYQTNSFTILSRSPKGGEATNNVLHSVAALATPEATSFQHPNENTWFRKEPLSLRTISNLRIETNSCPAPGQDKQLIIATTVFRVLNDTSLTYRCCCNTRIF